uniref:Uncharacterized protein n=1 Tax=Chelonoidis abingdonii TaxID=106734 RepID=A0A8C0G725_CHEAB
MWRATSSTRLRNNRRGALPGRASSPTAPGAAPELGRATQVARVSTASLGRFQPRLPKEPPAPPPRGGKKRHFEPLLGDLAAERSRQLELLWGVDRGWGGQEVEWGRGAGGGSQEGGGVDGGTVRGKGSRGQGEGVVGWDRGHVKEQKVGWGRSLVGRDWN